MPGDVVGVLLAGGRARRMGGGDKCLAMLGGQAMVGRIIGRVRPQVSTLILNANGDPTRLASFELPIVADVVDGFAGPLAGVLSGMMWVKVHVPLVPWLASVATDVPFVPRDLVARLRAAADRESAPIACAASNGQSHPVMALWSLALLADLRHALIDEGVRKVDGWTARYRVATVDFAAEPVDPFLNVNNPDDLKEVERLIASGFD